MTFLLFLASVAVIEYILRRDRPPSGQPPIKKQVRSYAMSSTPAADTGLLSLAQAVEQHGQGPETGTVDHEQAAHKSGADRV